MAIKRCILSFVCAAALVFSVCLPSEAAYPEKPIQLLVPWGAGGDSDLSMRIFAEFLTAELGKPVVVVNVPGQGGNKGNRQGKDAAPDGYTLTMVHESLITSAIVGMSDFTYKDFALVANVTYAPMYLAATPGTEWKGIPEMIEWAKANPGKLTFGATLGSVSHFFPLDVANAGNFELKIIPYEDTSSRMQGLLGGFIQLGETNPMVAVDLVAAGKLVMLGSASEERNELTPEIPTLKEQGLPVYIGVTRGILAPKGTPEEILVRLEEACKNVCSNPEFIEKIHASGSVSTFMDRAAYAQKLEEMTVHMTGLAQKFNILPK